MREGRTRRLDSVQNMIHSTQFNTFFDTGARALMENKAPIARQTGEALGAFCRVCRAWWTWTRLASYRKMNLSESVRGNRENTICKHPRPEPGEEKI
jgi:hypothetical protein